ncbi:MAG: ABC transporter ATP-binding protein [Candidatus Fimenecus sp.]
MTQEYAIKLNSLTKTFGEVKACDEVSLNLKKGEILALLGENGSGKTTLMNMLTGIYRPDSGSIFINGEEKQINSPEDAKRFGIGMVHQHFKLIESFTAADNIVVGIEKNGRESVLTKSFLNRKRYKEVRDVAEGFGFDIDPKKRVSDMSVSEKQTLEIVKVLYYGADVIILDEPTAVLTEPEIVKLFVVLKKMRAKGCSVIVISHKLNEVMELSDRVTVLRKGQFIKTVNTSETNEKELTELMVGKKVELNIARPKVSSTTPLLEVRELTVIADDGTKAIDNASFYIRGGEILGVAGISGGGQKELCEAIAGLRKISNGKIVHEGKNIVGQSPRQIIDEGISIGFIPEDRLGMGLAPSMDLTDNVILKTYKKDSKGPFVNRREGRNRAEKIVSELGVATPNIDTPVRLLSGGNVQKILVGREILGNPNVIITSYPVRGLDINSSYVIYDILNEQKMKGVGILFVGEDLDVLIELCDKILVLCKGKVMGIVHAEKTTKEELGLMMSGALDLQKEKQKPVGLAKDTQIKEEKNA